MKLLAGAALFSLLGCGQPAPPAPAPSIYAELVAAGCLAPSPDGPQAVADTLDAGVPWLDCLQRDGGTVASCAVPCGPATAQH